MTVLHIIPQVTSHIQNGITTDVNNVQFPLCTGISMPTLIQFNLIPGTGLATSIVTNYAPLTSGAAFPLNTVATTLDGFIISAPIMIGATSGIILDCERVIYTSLQGNTYAGDVQLNISGYDNNLVSIIASRVIPSATTSTYSFKTFRYITNINITNPAGGALPALTTPGNGSPTFIVGTGTAIGIPFVLNSLQQIVSVWWAGALIPQTSYGAYFTPAQNWRSTSQTAFTSFIRGAFVCPNNPNSSVELSITYLASGADPYVNTLMNNQSISAYQQIGVVRNISNTAYVLPSLVKYDSIGAQYPGDQDFINSYNILKSQ